MKLLKLIANLGYGSRKQVTMMFREGRIADADRAPLYTDDELGVHAAYDAIRVDGEPLDPPQGLLLMLHKPPGYVCSTKDKGRLIYDLLPPRFRLRDPVLSTVGRLDRDTSGLLLLTDDGALLHRIISPKSELSKVYEATLAEPLRGDEAAIFASGTLMLVNAIIAMGRSLHMRVVAEGIETRGQSTYLQSSGCTEGQGYYFGKPVDALAFEAMLKTPVQIQPG